MKRTPVITKGADGRTWYTWTLELKVSETWVEDGFQFADSEEAQERFAALLPYAHSHEFAARVLSAPKDSDVAKAQGYKSAKAWKESN